jgi:hypothetical protein
MFNQNRKAMYQVRFNLGKGDKFMKWKVTNPDGTVEYYEPSEVQVRMFDCFLRNQKGTAEKIFNGANKTVCAWVECDDVVVMPVEEELVSEMEEFTRVSYNPRVAPNWVCQGENADGEKLNVIVSEDRGLYTLIK